MKLNTNNEIALYSSIITAAFIFVLKNFFVLGKKKQMNKNKRRLFLKAKLFFGSGNKKVELKKFQSKISTEVSNSNSNYDRVRQFIQRISSDTRSNDPNAAPDAKKDKIFYSLVNNLLAKKSKRETVNN